MKKAENILQDIFNPDKSLPYDREELQMSITLNPQLKYFEEAIKIAQIDAIDAAVKMCAKNVTVECTEATGVKGMYLFGINLQSILQVADKLKKELE